MRATGDMVKNLFLFRDGEYSLEEMLERIPSDHYDPETDEIAKLLLKMGSDPEEVGRLTKTEFRNRLHKELSQEEYREEITELFNKVGLKGDELNFKFFDVPGMDYDGILELEGFEGELRQKYGEILDRELYLKKNRFHHSEKVVDLSFKYLHKMEDVRSDEDLPIQLLDPEGGQVVQTIEGDYNVRAPSNRQVEVRVFTESDLVAISNSKISEGIQGNIVDLLLHLSGKRGLSE